MQLDLVDVFGSRPLAGNALAVIHGAQAMTGEQMFALTKWLNFSESTFFLPPTHPDADYHIRIFFPGGELPFAGHPTLGSCRAWLERGGVPKHPDRIVQQCGAGLVELRRDGELLSFRAPPLITSGPLPDAERDAAARYANVPADWIIGAVHASNGPKWKLLHLRSADDVLAAKAEPRAPLGAEVGLVGAYPPGGPLQFELRALFANANGQLIEDPVTGSLNAAAAMYLFENGYAQSRYVAGQGQKVGADGRVHCSIDDDGAVWVGGRTDMIATGAALNALA
jgi:PhzF family phenazine biosynthesis protein